MHVAFITPEYPSSSQHDGGLGNYVRKVSQSLCARGHQATVFYLTSQDRTWVDGPVTVHEIRRPVSYLWIREWKPWQFIRPLLMQWLCCRRIAQHVWKQHRKTPFDILQASNTEIVGYGLKKNGRVPFVTRASLYTPMYRSHMREERKFSTYLRDWLELKQIFDSDGTFAPSEFVAQCFDWFESQHFDVVRTPIVKLENLEIDSSIYEQHLRGKKYFVFCGSLTRVLEKGVDLVLELLPKLLDDNSDLVFVFVGRDDAKFYGKKVIDYFYEQHPELRDRVIYFPTLPKARLYPVLRHSLALVLPSRFDNYPNICIEALQQGVLVVGSRESSIDEIVREGETGFLFRNANGDDLLSVLQRTIALTAEKRSEMTQAIAKWVESEVQNDRIGELLSYYEKIIQNYRSR